MLFWRLTDGKALYDVPISRMTSSSIRLSWSPREEEQSTTVCERLPGSI
jgi:hypothetical protein